LFNKIIFYKIKINGRFVAEKRKKREEGGKEVKINKNIS